MGQYTWFGYPTNFKNLIAAIFVTFVVCAMNLCYSNFSSHFMCYHI